MDIIKFFLLSAALTFSITGNAQQSMAASEEVKGGTCRKPANGKGCTANGQACVNAKDGEYFDATSFGNGIVKSHWKKGPVCGKAKATAFTYVTPAGFPAAVALPIQFCAPTQVQSGGGYDNIGKVAFVNCEYSFRTHKIPTLK